jgi:hypothetical protein
MSETACAVCGRPIRRERGEREEIYLSRRACSMPCRDELRSRTQLARAGARLEEAVRTWRQGLTAPSTHAQRYGVTTERFRDALRAAGRAAEAAAVPRAQAREPTPPRRRPRSCPEGWPLEDLLLVRLREVYGQRHSPSQQSLPPRTPLAA